MNCPNCDSKDIRVKDTRSYRDDRYDFYFVERRRKCRGCDLEFKTIEMELVVWQAVLEQGAEYESDNG